MRSIGDAVSRERQHLQKRQLKANDTSAASPDGPLPARVDPFIPEFHGKEMLAMVMKFDVRKPRRARRRQVYIEFELLEAGKHTGVRVWGVANYGDKPGPGSKYYQWWSIANEGRPSRRDRMTPRRFLGSVFWVRLATVTEDWDGDERPEATQYTKVKKILRLEARGAKSR